MKPRSQGKSGPGERGIGGSAARDADRGDADRRRRPYRPPRLVDFGDVRDLTLGGTPGTGDSGNPTQKPFAFGPGPPGPPVR